MEPGTPLQENDNTFHLGLCMAGAVSAGAYTAGVVDFLIEALEEWEKRRVEDKDQNQVPQHRVQIPVMGGASAGGMTSIIAGTVFNNKLVHIDKPGSDLLEEHPENKLYHSWVDLTDRDMFSKMLDTSDILPGTVISGLNSSFIIGIAKRVLQMDTLNWIPIPKFIPKGLKIFTTLTNLQGFDYSYNFQSDSSPVSGPKSPIHSSKYHSVIHNDYGCFQITEEPIEGANGGWIPLNLKDGTHVSVAIDSAMATGAFPVGLEARTVNRDGFYVNNNPWLGENIKSNPLPLGSYTTLNVDGGLVNNEPFEKVRDVLNSITKENDPLKIQSFDTFRSTVLMIEPFPTQEKGKISQDKGLFNIISLTLGAMLNQMRSKPTSIKQAMDNSFAGQNLITPSRKVPDILGVLTDCTGEKAIACGALSGFSGFLNKEFRVHDYFLGRYNCKIFLRDYFTIPETALSQNPIFIQGYNLPEENKRKFRSKIDPTAYQIIPIFEDPLNPFTFPDIPFENGKNWPFMSANKIDQYRPSIKKRIEKVILNIAPMGKLNKFLLWIGALVVLNRTISDSLLNAIKSDLKKWNLLS